MMKPIFWRLIVLWVAILSLVALTLNEDVWTKVVNATIAVWAIGELAGTQQYKGEPK